MDCLPVTLLNGTDKQVEVGMYSGFMEARAVRLPCGLHYCNSYYSLPFNQHNCLYVSSSAIRSSDAVPRSTLHIPSVTELSTLTRNKFPLKCLVMKKRPDVIGKNEGRLLVEASLEGVNVESLAFHPANEQKDEGTKYIYEKVSSNFSSASIDIHLYQTRRCLFRMAIFAALTSPCNPAFAVKQALLAGRIPGLSSPDENGFRIYRRPDEKSGGHGVGWSPIIPYSFKVSEDWEEVPVSIADLGGTEIDLRFTSLQEGNLSVIVAPVLRFYDGLDDNTKIEDIGQPEKVIDAFGPEVTGENVEDKVKATEVKNYNGRTYYQYVLEPHRFVSVTAAGNRLYIMSVSANGRQWKKHASDLKSIRDSFRVG